MRTTTVTIPNSDGELLHALVDLPDYGEPDALAVFAHCFTCNAHLKVVTYISEALTSNGIGVVRFDFTGLGHSEGEFADTNFSSNSQDLADVAEYLTANMQAPQLLVGHSLGGAAVLNVAARIPSIRAVATINAPAEPEHVRHLLSSAEDELERDGLAMVKIAGRSFTIKKQFIEDLEQTDLSEQVATLGQALLVLHSPTDTVVGVENAAKIFGAARHPKSYVSLDDADHLLSDPADAKYVGRVIANWFSRYQLRTSDRPSKFPDNGVVVKTGSGFLTDVWTTNHHVLVDEPTSLGGTDLGPNPYDYLLAGLGSCTTITLRMYADRKKIPLDSVSVALTHDRVHGKDCEDCETKDKLVDVVTRTITLNGDLTEEQRQSLLKISEKCPVHRTMTWSPDILLGNWRNCRRTLRQRSRLNQAHVCHRHSRLMQVPTHHRHIR